VPAVSNLYEKLVKSLRTFQFAGDFCLFWLYGLLIVVVAIPVFVAVVVAAAKCVF